MDLEDWHAMAATAAAVLAIAPNTTSQNVDEENIDSANKVLREYFAIERYEDDETRPNDALYDARERAEGDDDSEGEPVGDEA